jgi:hypothetical protein
MPDDGKCSCPWSYVLPRRPVAQTCALTPPSTPVTSSTRTCALIAHQLAIRPRLCVDGSLCACSSTSTAIHVHDSLGIFQRSTMTTARPSELSNIPCCLLCENTMRSNIHHGHLGKYCATQHPQQPPCENAVKSANPVVIFLGGLLFGGLTILRRVRVCAVTRRPIGRRTKK